MSAAERPAVEAAWRRVADTLQPLSAAAVAAAEAATAAGAGSSSGLSQAQYTSLVQVAEGVEQALGRSEGLPASAVSCGVPQMLFEAVAALLGLMALSQKQQQQQE
ncbi:hypothetical protein OEZ86_005047 [Tetradesmus obliquus]|nr:hypothetical protein OEZ86_005047 [Tetradesmus obliquus]